MEGISLFRNGVASAGEMGLLDPKRMGMFSRQGFDGGDVVAVKRLDVISGNVRGPRKPGMVSGIISPDGDG